MPIAKNHLMAILANGLHSPYTFFGEGKLKIIKSINPTSECIEPYKPSRMLNELRLHQTQITVVLKRINMNYINKLLCI